MALCYLVNVKIKFLVWRGIKLQIFLTKNNLVTLVYYVKGVCFKVFFHTLDF